MTISAPLRPGTPKGLAAGPLRNETMPSLIGSTAAGAAGAWALAAPVAASVNPVANRPAANTVGTRRESCVIVSPSLRRRMLLQTRNVFSQATSKRDPATIFNRIRRLDG